MILWLIIFGAGVALYVWLRVLIPFHRLRDALRRLAEGDFRSVILPPDTLIYRETSGHVRRISELLQQLDQQIADEGFSLRAILSSMNEGVLITDASQHIRLVNERVHHMFELRQSPINRSVMEVFRSHQLQLAVDQALKGSHPEKIQISVPAPVGGQAKHFEVHAGGLDPAATGRPVGVVIVFHDVTALKNLEAVRREFVANVSHEFRTPLAIISGYIETLLDGALDDRPMAEKSLQAMHKNAQRLTLLIEDLLTISRMEHREKPLDVQRVNLREALDRVLEQMEPAMRERKAKIRMEWAADAMMADASAPRIEQVYFNLLENAIRYGGASDEVQLTIRAVARGENIEITFADNGPGIPLDDQPHIFERFYRVHKDRSRIAGGTGLGLSIVKNVMQAHGGSVSLESKPGAGAAFTVTLPIRRAATVQTQFPAIA